MAVPSGLRPGAASAGRLRWGRFAQWGMIAIVLIECGFIIRLDVLNAPYLKSSYSYFSGRTVKPVVVPSRPLLEKRDESRFMKPTGVPLRPPEKQRAGTSEVVGNSALVIQGDRPVSLVPSELENRETCTEDFLENVDRVAYVRNFSKQPVLVVSAETQVSGNTAVWCNPLDLAMAPCWLIDGAPLEEAMYAVWSTCDVPCVFRGMRDANPADGVFGLHDDTVAGRILRSMESSAYYSDNDLATARGHHVMGYKLRPGAGHEMNKVEALQKYKFSLAFENSNVEDYVTEKFFQSLVAGSVPVVVGPPNVADFAPGPNTFLHIRDLADVKHVAVQMKLLASNATAYNETIRWKFEGPSDSFLALVDMAAVHSSCRLCIYLATQIQFQEEDVAPKRPCQCTRKSGILHHLYVRERGRFEMESIFLGESELTVEGLKQAVLRKFTTLNHEPIWKTERPDILRGDENLKIYRIYPVNLSQREALYSWSFKGDDGVKSLVLKYPCLKLEVIFV